MALADQAGEVFAHRAVGDVGGERLVGRKKGSLFGQVFEKP
jgi:hypothetical protein